MHARIFIVALSIALGGCSGARSITVATDAVFPPFHYVDDSGALAGFDVALARAAGERAGYDVHVVRGESFRALFEGLESDRYDVVAATAGITPARRERYGFTRPYFVTCLAALVRARPGEPRTPADLVGRRIAAAEGTTSEAAARAIDGATVVTTNRKLVSLAKLRAGEVDAVVIDEFEAVPFAMEADDLEVLAEPVGIESYGFVLRRDDTELRRGLDAAINAMEADGALAELRVRHGLDRPPGWPVRVTVAPSTGPAARASRTAAAAQSSSRRD